MFTGGYEFTVINSYLSELKAKIVIPTIPYLAQLKQNFNNISIPYFNELKEKLNF